MQPIIKRHAGLLQENAIVLIAACIGIKDFAIAGAKVTLNLTLTFTYLITMLHVI